MPIPRWPIAVSLFLIGACGESVILDPTTPSAIRSAALRSARSASPCVEPASAVVYTEGELRAALLTASAGDVIAISGTIGLRAVIEISTPGVTLTCANAGDGLASAPGFDPGDLFDVLAADVTVQGLRLDADGLSGWAIFAWRDNVHAATNVTIRNNDVRCGDGCVFFVGVNYSAITDNHFASTNASTGIHLQASHSAIGDLFTDGVHIERNVLLATAPQGFVRFGAIRPRDGADMVIQDNQIVGPWSNGIATTELRGSVFQENTIEGVRQYGLWIGSTRVPAIQVRGLLVKRNVISSAGNSAVFVNQACGNVLVGNRLSAAPGSPRVFFTASTGDNMLLGESSTTVDNGAQDCDGDGTIDPNFVSGGHRKGAAPGEVIGPVMRHSHGILVQ